MHRQNHEFTEAMLMNKSVITHIPDQLTYTHSYNTPERAFNQIIRKTRIFAFIYYQNYWYEPTLSRPCAIKVEVIGNIYDHWLRCTHILYITVAPLHEYVMKSTEIRRMEFYIVLPSPSSSFSLSVLLPHPLSSIGRRSEAFKYLTFQNDLRPSSSFTLNQTYLHIEKEAVSRSLLS